jgi:RNA recognition motif-containing protein
MTNAKIPGSLCYGYVTMASVEDAMKCIELLHKSEIQGRLVTVEKAKSLTLPGSKASKALKVNSMIRRTLNG